MATQKLTEAQKEALAKQLEEEKIIKEEKRRTVIEKYKFKQIGGWSILPYLLLILLIIAGAVDYFLISKSFNPYIVVPAGIIVGLTALTSDIDEHWKKRLACKNKIHDEDVGYKWIEYDYDYIYTDSIWRYFGYKIAKFTLCLLSLLAGGTIIVLLFMWVGAIPPTTIIIILLLMILFK